MHIEDKYSWLKHLDFMMIDMAVLICAFSVSYLWKFKSIAWWQQSKWSYLLVFVCLLDVLITLITNPYSGVIRRGRGETVLRCANLTFINLIVSCIAFYVLKIGVLFSREMLIEMYVIYFVAGSIIKILWKKYVGSRILQNKIPLYIVCESGKEKEIVRNSMAEDLPRYQVVGSSNDYNHFLQDLKEKDAKEILIAVNPGVICKEIYEYTF